MLETRNGERRERTQHCLGVDVVLNLLKESIDELPETIVDVGFNPSTEKGTTIGHWTWIEW